ncbi:hypothetical protein [Pantoea coffeiphila]|uniref:hypothetical protein n=1 Tax=Pantoea coffeiphila TaxID=1465635 RepID=UPI001C0EE7A1|nr:hypothetical protein [Pantoea coffeiphila]
MKSKTNKTLGEILIGEAALALLDEKTPVSWSGILGKLETRLADESDESKAEVLVLAISDIRKEMQRRGLDDKNNDDSHSTTSFEGSNRLTRH